MDQCTTILILHDTCDLPINTLEQARIVENFFEFFDSIYLFQLYVYDNKCCSATGLFDEIAIIQLRHKKFNFEAFSAILLRSFDSLLDLFLFDIIYLKRPWNFIFLAGKFWYKIFSLLFCCLIVSNCVAIDFNLALIKGRIFVATKLHSCCWRLIRTVYTEYIRIQAPLMLDM